MHRLDLVLIHQSQFERKFYLPTRRRPRFNRSLSINYSYTVRNVRQVHSHPINSSRARHNRSSETCLHALNPSAMKGGYSLGPQEPARTLLTSTAPRYLIIQTTMCEHASNPVQSQTDVNAPSWRGVRHPRVNALWRRWVRDIICRSISTKVRVIILIWKPNGERKIQVNLIKLL